MDLSNFKKLKLPEMPGVYFFLGPRKEILYIGKATNLQSRTRSYFASDIKEKRSELIEQMVSEAKAVEWTVTDSVLEALILETNLIRTHKPRYNTRSKDDKSYNHLIITKEEWPRVLVVRGKDLATFARGEIAYEFGPFPSGTLFKEALKIVRRLFRFYDTKQPLGSEKSKLAKGRIDFNRQIGLYPQAGEKLEYLRTIRHIRMFFEGKKQSIITELQKDMMASAKREEFEIAALLKRRIFALQHIQDVSLIKDDNRLYRDDKSVRIEAYDIAHLGGQDMVGVMVVVEGGEPAQSEYRNFTIRTVDKSNDKAALSEVLARRLAHREWPTPQLLVVDGNLVQKRAAEAELKVAGLVVPVVAVVKDDRHRPKGIIGPKDLVDRQQKDILLANFEAHRFAISLHRKKRRKRIG